MSLRVEYLPPIVLDWAGQHAWLLDEIAVRWLRSGEPPGRPELQHDLLARGVDIYLAEVLEAMPRPLGWIEPSEQRIVLTLFGLRVTPCVHKQIVGGLGRLVALAVDRYRANGTGAYLSRSDIERLFGVEGPAAPAFCQRLFTELPFLGQRFDNGVEADGEALVITEYIARYTRVCTADDYLRIRAEEVRHHPQFGWRPWEPPEPVAPVEAADAREYSRLTAVLSRARRFLNHQWVVGVGAAVLAGVIVALILER
jgi:hypothetical protein